MDENTPVQEDSFSFKKVFELIRKSAKRMLIYALIATIIGASVAAIVVVATRGDTDYKGIIEYSYKNIDDGLDPKGNALDINRIKSNVVISNALNAMGNMSQEKIADILPILSDDIIINGYISDIMRKSLEANATLTFFPSRYEIIIRNNIKTGLSKNQYVDFLNKLMESYSSYFSEYYNFGRYVPLAISEDTVASANDYINAIKAYENELANLQAEINSLPSSYITLRNKLQARLNIVSTQVSDAYAYILKNNVQKQDVSLSLEKYLDNDINKFTDQEAMYAAKASRLDTIIKEYKVIYKQITDTNNTLSVTVADVSKYNELFSEYLVACDNEAIYQTKIAESGRAKDQIDALKVSGEYERNVIESKFDALYESYKMELKGINEELTNFSKLNLMSNGVNVAMSASKQVNVSYPGAIVAFVIILLTGVFAAMYVTYIKNNKLKKGNVAKDKEE